MSIRHHQSSGKLIDNLKLGGGGMKSVVQFKDEITGCLYATKEEAVKAESKSRDIKDAFSFYIDAKEHPKDGNDDVGVQRTEEFYARLVSTLIRMVEKYEPWILPSYDKVGGLTPKYVGGHSFLGRFLDDSNSPLYYWWGKQGNICPNCFREYGQMYYALNCKCEKEPNAKPE